MWYTMDWKTFTTWELGALVSGALIGWVAKWWCDSYAEAKDRSRTNCTWSRLHTGRQWQTTLSKEQEARSSWSPSFLYF